MTILEAIVMGVVQGLTEFLPISSSGHLVLADYFFGFSPDTESLDLAVGIATNTGTLLAVLLLLRRDVASALTGFVSGLLSAEARRSEGWRLALLVLAGSIPTALLGLALRGVFERLNAPLPVAIALAFTGFVLWITPASGSKTSAGELSFRDAVIAGFAQGIAVVPGISRSGATIATLLSRNCSGELAARFSFLLYLVASLGVALLGVTELRSAAIGIGPLVAMTVASFITGFAALKWLFRILRRGRFRIFAPYLWAVSAITLMTVLLR